MQIECVLMHKYCCVTHGCCLVWIFVFIFTATAKKRKNKNNTKWLRDFKCVSWFQISLRFKIKNFTLEILEKVSDHCVLFLAWIILKFHPTLISSSKTIYHAWVFFNILFHIRVFFYIISFWLDISSVPPPLPFWKRRWWYLYNKWGNCKPTFVLLSSLKREKGAGTAYHRKKKKCGIWD